MTPTIRHIHVLSSAIFIAFLAHASMACGDSGGNDDVTARIDAGPGSEAGPDVSPDSSRDTGDDAGRDGSDDQDDGCELEGFDLDGQSVITEHPEFWNFRGWSADRSRQIEIFIYTDDINEGDRFEFGEQAGEASDHLLLAFEMCPNGQWCETVFKASGGAIEIETRTDVPYGLNELIGRLVDVELVEGEINSAGHFRETWAGDAACVEDAPFRTPMEEMQDFAPTCDSSGFEPDPQLSSADYASGVVFARVRTADTPRHTLELVTKNLVSGTYPLNDFRLDRCNPCLFLYEGCETASCQRTYAAGAGELEISQTGVDGTRFVARATGVEMAEATLDTWEEETQLIEGGAGWCIDEVEWDLIIGESAGD